MVLLRWKNYNRNVYSFFEEYSYNLPSDVLNDVLKLADIFWYQSKFFLEFLLFSDIISMPTRKIGQC